MCLSPVGERSFKWYDMGDLDIYLEFSPPVGERSFKSYLLEAAYCLALYITLRRGLQNRLYFIDNPISISYKPVSIYSDADF